MPPSPTGENYGEYFLKDDFEIHLALYSNIIEFTIPPEIKIFNLNEPLVQDKAIRFLKLPYILESLSLL